MKRRQSAIGPMSKNSADVPHFIAERVELETPDRLTNASTRDPLNLAWEWRRCIPRPGSLHAFTLPSKGV